MSEAKRFLSAVMIYIVGNLLRGILPLSRYTLAAYLFGVFLYALTGLVLGGGCAGRKERRFWLWAGAGMLLVLLVPLVPLRPLYQVSFFLVTSHVEILPALLLGVCVSHLLPGRQRS